MIKSKAEDYGICCTSCQENVNIHECAKCGKEFVDGDEIYCKSSSRYDSEHYHLHCVEEENGTE